jgi:hypothetical protein
MLIVATPAINANYPGSFTIDPVDATGQAAWHYAIQDKYLDPLNGAQFVGGKPDQITLDQAFTVNDGSGATNAVANGHVFVTLLGADII